MIQEVWNLFIERGDFFLNLCLEHLLISGIAISIAIVLGGLIGILISEYQRSSKPIISMINFLYTIPSISMLGFLIPLSGIGNMTAIIALTLYALLPMVRNTYTGISNVNKNIIEAATGMGSTKYQVLYKIKIPLAFPVIMSGIRNMVIMTLALTGIASFIGAGGLGVAIYRGITTNNTAMTLAGSLLIACIALSADFLLGIVERMILKRRKRGNRKYIAAGCAILATAVLIFSLITNFKSTPTLHIATKPMSEQYVLGEMLKIMIEEQSDIQVEITHGVGGGTANIQPAMEKGEFDLYPEYTGTGWNMVLKRKELYSEDMFQELQRNYQNDYQMQWEGMLGFTNTYALAVHKDIADTYGLEKISDLKSIANQLTFGANYDFYEREDGYLPLCEAYGFTFNETVDLDIGLKYQAINQKEIDVMPVFTTDGQLSVSDIVVLEDDLGFYPSYSCGIVIRSEILETYPELSSILNHLEGSITNLEMARMNYQVEHENAEPSDIAKTFLSEKGLLSGGTK